jgi:hypothetical protein
MPGELLVSFHVTISIGALPVMAGRRYVRKKREKCPTDMWGIV